MKITGIIAEFNPLHNGHAYLLQKAREITDADVIVVVLSGNFVQRGAPAIVSKYARTKAALCCGADLILELPVFAACASAEYFAAGAVRLLSDIGADAFVFGSESGELDRLLPLSALLSDEPEEYRKLLRAGLCAGKSFPVARKAAVLSLLSDAAPLLDTPNNLLALEYLKTCRQRRLSLIPHTIARLGSSYHENKILAHSFPSASALRSLLQNQSIRLTKLLPYMPAAAAEILSAELACHTLVSEADLSNLLACHLLQCTSPAQLSLYADMGADLANRVFARRYDSILLPDFCAVLKTKELTFTRISRALLHTILQITGEEQEEFRALLYSPYMRVLGMRKSARPLLARLRKESNAPLILRPARAKKLLSAQAYRFFMKDIASSELYRQLSFAHSHLPSPCEFAHEIICCE